MVEVLENLDTATLERHAATITSKLDDSDPYVRKGLLQTLGSLEAPSLFLHASAIVTKLEDSAPNRASRSCSHAGKPRCGVARNILDNHRREARRFGSLCAECGVTDVGQVSCGVDRS